MEERTILVIEADENIQNGIKEALGDKPCRFVFVDQAEEAVVSLMTEMPNAVILSLELPGGDGVDVLSNIRDMDEEIPIIILTGAPTKEKLLAAKRAKAIDILLKPPDYARICSKVSAYMWVSDELAEKTVKSDEPVDAFAAAAKAALGDEPAQPEPFVEAIPKGAEVVNINDTIAGMRVARTLVLNGVVYADKGQVLTDKVLTNLNRMGVPEICVYTDNALKKKVEERKKKMATATVVTTPTTSSGEKTFSKVKRSAVRAQVNAPATMKRKLKDGTESEFPAEIADISGGGCALLTADPLEKGEEIILNFELDDGKFPMKDIRGIVRHSMKRFGTEALPQRSGIFFNSITEKFRENLITLVFKIERDNKQKEDMLRARFGYAPKKYRPPSS